MRRIPIRNLKVGDQLLCLDSEMREVTKILEATNRWEVSVKGVMFPLVIRDLQVEVYR